MEGIEGAVTGANELDFHFTGVDQQRDFTVPAFTDLRMAVPGDPCPRCEGGRLEGHRVIEVGQNLYIGTKYTKAMGATFLDAEGQARPVEMGCYGIGITRLMAAAVEQNHDENGIIWSFPLAPFQVLLLPINYKEKAVREVTDDLYQKLSQNSLEVLLDDRDERPGVKFKDADLIGVPTRVTVGAKGLQKGNVEVRKRLSGETADVSLADAVQKVQSLVT